MDKTRYTLKAGFHTQKVDRGLTLPASLNTLSLRTGLNQRGTQTGGPPIQEEGNDNRVDTVPKLKTKRTQTKGFLSESRVRVRYAETDQMGVAYYANYLVWFEVGRSQYCNDRGFSYRDMERETGLYLMVAEATCRYSNAARYEDELVVKTRVTHITRRTVRFGYLIERPADGVKIATGETLHVLATRDGRLSSFPEKYRGLLEV